MNHPETWYLILLTILIVATGGWQIFKPNSGTLFRLLGWGGIIAIIMIVYVLRAEISQIPQRIHAEFTGSSGVADSKTMRYRLDERGHGLVEVYINQQAILMLIDTGASNVMLQASDAAKLGINPPPDAYHHRVSTANGSVLMARTILPQIKIGTITLNNISGYVSAKDTGISLLGMSALGRLQLNLGENYLTLTE